MTTWLKDDRGNKNSVEYWGSKEAAQKALDSLKNCDNCTNCSRCSGCSDCSDCEKLENAKDREGVKPSWHVPDIENIHQKILGAVSKEGAFDMSLWHTCETTHCRAGLIYYTSSLNIPVSMTRFYEDNETAMADIKRCAELEAKDAQ